jgi:hypothetical protein
MNIRKIIREEAEGLEWIKDVSTDVPNWGNRTTVDYEEFFGDIIQENEEVLEILLETGMLLETDEEGDITVGDRHFHWDDVGPYNWELRESTMWGFENSKWEYVGQSSQSYDLEYSSFTDLIIYKRKSDGRHFAYRLEGSYHDADDVDDRYLTEVFLVNVPTWM